MRKLLSIAVVITLAGCGTLNRSEIKESQGPVLYPALKWDQAYLDTAFRGEAVEMEQFAQSTYKALSPFIIVDMPISIVTDTILLPYDAIVKKYSKEKSEL